MRPQSPMEHLHNLMPTRQPGYDSPVAMDPFYRFPAAHPALIRITGGQRVIVSSDILTTYYSWTLAYHPQSTSDYGSKPLDVWPPISGGPKSDESLPVQPNEEEEEDGETAPPAPTWPAVEASGSDAVPTDGSVVVLAWPSPSQDMLIFHYAPPRFGRVLERFISGGTIWWSWEEVEPGERTGAGQQWARKTRGLSGSDQPAAAKNPLFEIGGRTEVPKDSIVRVWAHAARIDPDSDAGYLLERPEATVTELEHASEDDEASTRQEITWRGALGGTYKLRIRNSAGEDGLSGTIQFTDDAAAIETAIVASGVVTNVAINGDGESFSVQFDDDYLHVPPVEVVDADMWSDTPYYFAWQLWENPAFPAKITARRRTGTSSKWWQYSWVEREGEAFAEPLGAGTRTGTFNLVEHNNRRVPIDTVVWIQRIYGEDAGVTFRLSRQGNGSDVSAEFQLFIERATGGTFTLGLAGVGTTDPIAWDADATTIKDELEDATGLTFESFTGSGTRADPWVFSETGAYAARTPTAGVLDLIGNKTYAFEYDGELDFPAKITNSAQVADEWSHSWVEMCSAGPNVRPVEKTGGRSGTMSTASGAINYNGHQIANDTIVDMREVDDAGDGDDLVEITRTQNGNGSDTPTIWEVLINANEGEYTLAIDSGDETSLLSYSAGSSAVDAALEAASGLTVTITGNGLPGDPFVITVTSDNDSHTLTVETNNLAGAAYMFAGGYTGAYVVYENRGDENGPVAGFIWESVEYEFVNGLLVRREVIWP